MSTVSLSDEAVFDVGGFISNLLAMMHRRNSHDNFGSGVDCCSSPLSATRPRNVAVVDVAFSSIVIPARFELFESVVEGNGISYNPPLQMLSQLSSSCSVESPEHGICTEDGGWITACKNEGENKDSISRSISSLDNARHPKDDFSLSEAGEEDGPEIMTSSSSWERSMAT